MKSQSVASEEHTDQKKEKQGRIPKRYPVLLMRMLEKISTDPTSRIFSAVNVICNY